MSAVFSNAQTLYERGKPAEAAQVCRDIVKESPRDPQANHLLAKILLESGIPADAEYHAKAALVGDMRNADYHFLLGRAYQAQGKTQDAITAYERALLLKPDHFDAFGARVKIAFDAENFEDADRLLTPMVARYPEIVTLLSLLLHVRKQQKRNEEVVALGDRILKLEPGYSEPQLLIRYGLALAEVGRLNDSILYLKQVLAILRKEGEPTAENQIAMSDMEYNIALAYDNLGQFDLAKEHYLRGIEDNPEHHNCRFAYETLLIKVSDLKGDLSSFNMRFLLKDRVDRGYPFPLWQGQPLEGKRLLLWSEQGIGDIAMFASFLPYVLSKVSFLMIDMIFFMVPIFVRSFPQAEVHPIDIGYKPSDAAMNGNFDYHAPMGNMMIYLMKDYLPRTQRGFLKPNPERLIQLRKRYEALGPGLKVGISWRTIHPSSKFRRDIPLEEWGPILKLPGCQFISLQYSGEEEELAMAREKFGVDIFLDKEVKPLVDRDDFLTQIAAMDLVVSIQNSAVHMGGAAGVDTILMLSRSGDFRWGAIPEESVFYPSVQIVRQAEYGHWAPVIEKVAGMVKAKIKS